MAHTGPTLMTEKWHQPMSAPTKRGRGCRFLDSSLHCTYLFLSPCSLSLSLNRSLSLSNSLFNSFSLTFTLLSILVLFQSPHSLSLSNTLKTTLPAPHSLLEHFLSHLPGNPSNCWAVKWPCEGERAGEKESEREMLDSWQQGLPLSL